MLQEHIVWQYKCRSDLVMVVMHSNANLYDLFCFAERGLELKFQPEHSNRRTNAKSAEVDILPSMGC